MKNRYKQETNTYNFYERLAKKWRHGFNFRQEYLYRVKNS